MHIYLRYIFILYCMYCQTIVLPQRSDFGTCYTYIRKKMHIYLRYIFILYCMYCQTSAHAIHTYIHQVPVLIQDGGRGLGEVLTQYYD